MKVNCIGDSHISAFFEKGIMHTHLEWFSRDIFNVNHVGPILAFNLNEKDFIINFCNSIPNDEQLLLCFGEIDCRAQVGKHILDTKDYQMVIDGIISKYIIFLDSIKNKNIILWGLTPCLKDKPFEDWFDADETRKNLFFATKGTKTERNEYKRYFNQKLEMLCQERGFKYLSIFDDVLDKSELYVDDIHLDGEMVRELIRSKF